LAFAADRAHTRYGVLAINPVKVVPLCHPVVGAWLPVEVVAAYSTVWLPGFAPLMVTALTVMLFDVAVPFKVGAPLTAAPSPSATALAVTVPVGTIAAVASVTLAAGIVAG